jgi:hypothetical protein
MLWRVAAGLGGAFIAVVVVGVATSCAYVAFRVGVSGKGSIPNASDGFEFVALTAAYISGSVALPTILVVALPFVLISQKLKRTSLTYYLVAGVVISTVVAVLTAARRLLYPAPPFQFGPDEAFLIVVAIAAGGLAALAFWKIARPDRTT